MGKIILILILSTIFIYAVIIAQLSSSDGITNEELEIVELNKIQIDQPTRVPGDNINPTAMPELNYSSTEEIILDNQTLTGTNDIVVDLSSSTILTEIIDKDFALGLIYPGARMIKQSNNVQIYEVNIANEAVVDWYEDVIENQKYNVKSYVTSTANNISVTMIKLLKSLQEYEIKLTELTRTTTLIEIKSL